MRSTWALILVFAAFAVACSGSKPHTTSHADEADDGGETEDAGPPANTAPNSLDDVIQDMVAANGASGVSSGLYSLVASVISDPTAQQQIDSEIDARIGGQTSGPFPVIPFSILGNVLTLFDEFDSSSAPAAAPAPVAFNLDPSTSDTCTPAFPTLSPINAQLPGLSEGNIPNTAADPCALSHLQDFVAALNGMAMSDGSTVTDGANTYTTVADTITDLARHTHRHRRGQPLLRRLPGPLLQRRERRGAGLDRLRHPAPQPEARWCCPRRTRVTPSSSRGRRSMARLSSTWA